MNTCGECSFCCLAMEVTELKKPKDQWCAHVEKGKGCTIYNRRPLGCHKFSCSWLFNNWQDQSLRPDKAKVMFSATGRDEIIMCIVHKDYPNAWKEGRVAKAIERLLERYHIIVMWRDKRTFLGGKAPLDHDMEQELLKVGAAK